MTDWRREIETIIEQLREQRRDATETGKEKLHAPPYPNAHLLENGEANGLGQGIYLLTALLARADAEYVAANQDTLP